MAGNFLEIVPAEINVALGFLVLVLAAFFVRQLRSTLRLAVRLCRLQAFVHARRYLEAHRCDGSLTPADIFEGEVFLNEKGAEFGFLPYPHIRPERSQPA